MTTTQVRPLTPYQVRRYSRHIIMPQVGSAGQRKLIDAKVLIVGGRRTRLANCHLPDLGWRRHHWDRRFRRR